MVVFPTQSCFPVSLGKQLENISIRSVIVKDETKVPWLPAPPFNIQLEAPTHWYVKLKKENGKKGRKRIQLRGVRGTVSRSPAGGYRKVSADSTSAKVGHSSSMDGPVSSACCHCHCGVRQECTPSVALLLVSVWPWATWACLSLCVLWVNGNNIYLAGWWWELQWRLWGLTEMTKGFWARF